MLIKTRVIELLATAAKKPFPEACRMFEEMQESEYGRAFYKLLEAIHDEAVEEGIERAPGAGLPEDIKQVVWALQRAQKRLQHECEQMASAGNYDAMFPESDASLIGSAIAYIRLNNPEPAYCCESGQRDGLVWQACASCLESPHGDAPKRNMNFTPGSPITAQMENQYQKLLAFTVWKAAGTRMMLLTTKDIAECQENFAPGMPVIVMKERNDIGGLELSLVTEAQGRILAKEQNDKFPPADPTHHPV